MCKQLTHVPGVNNSIPALWLLICIVPHNQRAERYTTTEERLASVCFRCSLFGEEWQRQRSTPDHCHTCHPLPQWTWIVCSQYPLHPWTKVILLLLALAKALTLRKSLTISTLLGNAYADHWKVIKFPGDNNADMLPPSMSQTSVNPSIQTPASSNGIPVSPNQIHLSNV